MYDVIIIGGGVIGASVARQLSQYRLKIALLEADPKLAIKARQANAAVVHGGYAEPYKTLKGRLSFQGRQDFPQLEKELSFGFRPTGSLVVATNESEKEDLKSLFENGIKNGIEDLELLDRSQVLALEPNIHHNIIGALHCAGAGICSPYSFITAMVTNAVENGTHLHLNSKVTQIEKQETGFLVTTKSGEKLLAHYLVNAAGLGSEEISKMAGAEPVRLSHISIQHLFFQGETDNLPHNVIFQSPKSTKDVVLVTPTVHGNLAVGTAITDPLGLTQNIDPQQLYKIYWQALHTAPGLDINQFIKRFVGVQSVGPCGDFLIEESQSTPGFIQIHGIHIPGLTASPAIAHRVAGLLADAGLPLVRSPRYNPYRHSLASPQRPARQAQTLAELVPLPQNISQPYCKKQASKNLASIITFSSLDKLNPRANSSAVHYSPPSKQGSKELLEELLLDPLDLPTSIESEGPTPAERQELLDYFAAQMQKETI